MDLAGHFRIILQNWWRILVISLVIAVAVFAYSASQPNVYSAGSVLQVNVGSVNTGDSPLTVTTFYAQTYAELAKSPSVVSTAVKSTGLHLGLKQAQKLVSADAQTDLGFINVKARGSSPAAAAALSRGLSQSIIDTVGAQQQQALLNDLGPLEQQLSALQTQLASTPAGALHDDLSGQIDALNSRIAQRRTAPTNSIFVLSGARPPTKPVSPKPLQDAFFGFLISLVAVSELTVLVHYVGDRFSRNEDSAEIVRFSGLPLLAKVPQGTGPEVVEAFRILRTNLMFLEGAGKPRTLAVVSANANVGKTFTSVHLARSAAGLDEKVVLVDADLRKPSIHQEMAVDRQPGLSDVLQGGDIASALRKGGDNPFLRVLPSGGAVQDPSGVLGARAFRHVLDALRAVRLVVVDTPPAELFADAMAVASQCDATVFVIDTRTSRRRAVRDTLEALERAGANLVGVVVNRAAAPRRSGYYES